jgi:2-polyprenyl-3-methyl-5-hydroxy-6-metoxy-1,4-benzoquinol methylase
MTAPALIVASSSKTCTACLNGSGNATILLPGDPSPVPPREMFAYSECAHCGSLDIVKIPDNLGSYYPDSYYSLAVRRTTRLRRVLRALRDRHEIFDRNLVGHALSVVASAHRMSLLRPIANGEFGMRLHEESAILDYGCGGGSWLRDLHSAGFRNLFGVDPFLREPLLQDGLRLDRGGLDAVSGTFDLISCSHVLEHTEDPEQVLRVFERHLHEHGVLLLRIPIAASYLWKKYGADWVQLDAPRHLHLYSAGGARLLFERAGFRVERVVFDSSEFSVIGSELRRLGLGPHQVLPAGVSLHEVRSVHSARAARRRMRIANALGSADQASFYLKRATR